MRDLLVDPLAHVCGAETALSVRGFTDGYDIDHPHRVPRRYAYRHDTREASCTREEEWRRAHQEAGPRQRRL